MRILKGVTAAWERGEIDDATLKRRYVRVAWQLAVAIFGALTAVTVVGLALEGRHLGNVWQLVVLFGVMGCQVGLLLVWLARRSAVEAIESRARTCIEADAEQRGECSQATDAPLQVYVGSYRRSRRWSYVIMVMGLAELALAAALYGGLHSNDIRLDLIAGLGLAFVGIGVYQRFDGRPYLDISSEGIWCRSWGKERLEFREFKAVYQMRRGFNKGVVLVPHTPRALEDRLSFWGRRMLRVGASNGLDGAHAWALPIWLNRVELSMPIAQALPHLLRALDARIVGRC